MGPGRVDRTGEAAQALGGRSRVWASASAWPSGRWAGRLAAGPAPGAAGREGATVAVWQRSQSPHACAKPTSA